MDLDFGVRQEVDAIGWASVEDGGHDASAVELYRIEDDGTRVLFTSFSLTAGSSAAQERYFSGVATADRMCRRLWIKVTATGNYEPSTREIKFKLMRAVFPLFTTYRFYVTANGGLP